MSLDHKTFACWFVAVDETSILGGYLLDLLRARVTETFFESRTHQLRILNERISLVAFQFV